MNIEDRVRPNLIFRNSTNSNGDVFVGIKLEESSIQITFPVGFNISDNINERRDDTIVLMEIMKKYAELDGFVSELGFNSTSTNNFPVESYLYLIKHHLRYGYFYETEPTFSINSRGKINWQKTIKEVTPKIIDGNFLYFDFVIKNTINSEDSWISLVYEYCVYESFRLLGWMFTSYTPREPRFFDFDQNAFRSIILRKTHETFNDSNRQLFLHLLNIVESFQNGEVPIGYNFGTTKFEYVWEKIVNSCFNNVNKKEYLPRTYWKMKNDTERLNAHLYPDTILYYDNAYYILDAKYYKYGISGNVKDLPDSSSINKQIIYGEFIIEKLKSESNVTVYNAFIFPTNKSINSNNVNIINIGEATSDWINKTSPHTKIKAILIDTKYLIKTELDFDKNVVLNLCKEISD